MYRLSRLRFVFPIGLFVMFVLDGSVSKVFSGFLFSYPYAMVSHLIVLWLVLACFFEEDVHIPIYGFAVAVGVLCDVYYSGILGLFMFLYPLIVWLTKLIAQYFPTTFLSVLMIFFIDIAMFEFLNFIAYAATGVMKANFANFLLYDLAPTLALNLIFLVILYFPIRALFDKYRVAKRA